MTNECEEDEHEKCNCMTCQFMALLEQKMGRMMLRFIAHGFNVEISSPKELTITILIDRDDFVAEVTVSTSEVVRNDAQIFQSMIDHWSIAKTKPKSQLEVN